MRCGTIASGSNAAAASAAATGTVEGTSLWAWTSVTHPSCAVAAAPPTSSTVAADDTATASATTEIAAAPVHDPTNIRTGVVRSSQTALMGSKTGAVRLAAIASIQARNTSMTIRRRSFESIDAAPTDARFVSAREATGHLRAAHFIDAPEYLQRQLHPEGAAAFGRSRCCSC
jgi:hypothetical protein